MKFVLLVEGDTEEKCLPKFIKKWLDPQLKQPVTIDTNNLEGCEEFLRNVARFAQKELNDPKNSDLIGVIGLLDLYGPQKFYPADVTSVEERYRWGKKHIQTQVNNDRFRMHFAVHEIEAWLLSQPKLFPRQVSEKLPGKVQHPETVNFDTPPAKLLNSLYRQHLQRHYNKVVYGKTIFQSLDPHEVYLKCPHFAAMMDDLLIMAHQAGL